MSVLSTRLKELRENRSQAEFARFLSLSSQQTYQRWEDGKTLPNSEILHTIATRCGVSVDWLLGLSDKKTLKFEVKEFENIKPSDLEVSSALLAASIPQLTLKGIHDMAHICFDHGNIHGLRLIVDELIKRAEKSDKH